MPDFTARFAVGTSIKDWLDPATETKPSRINSRPGYPQKRVVGTVGVEVEIRMTIATADAPLDSNKLVGGRNFVATMVDGQTHSIQGVAGQSSVQKFTPTAAGHYHIRIRRPQGGAVHLHLDVEEP